MFQFIRGVTISGLETENGNPLHLFAMYVSTINVHHVTFREARGVRTTYTNGFY